MKVRFFCRESQILFSPSGPWVWLWYLGESYGCLSKQRNLGEDIMEAGYNLGEVKDIMEAGYNLGEVEDIMEAGYNLVCREGYFLLPFKE